MPVRPLPPVLQPEAFTVPELLAPAGNWETLRAGLACGADAVYFGLDEGFNARARADNFRLSEIEGIVDEVHRAGACAFVTLNTLLFERELAKVARVVSRLAAAGVDAVIVQDPAVCLLAREIAPEMEVHASTQMTISSVEGIAFARSLGCTKVVVPRELSVSEIAALREHDEMDLEVFVHGALCMSWSGQCLSSEAWGGRSANRGQCAQACRLPYELMVDGEHVPTGELRYFLSPRDLAAHRAVPALMMIGVETLKIEGRLKSASFVATAVRAMRRWIDHVAARSADSEQAQRALADDLRDATIAYSRGFSDGFLGGSDHQLLVDGRFPRTRGYLLGVVTRVDVDRVVLAPPQHDEPKALDDPRGSLLSPLPTLGRSGERAAGPPVAPVIPERGMGVAFDAGDPQSEETGGPIFDVAPRDEGWELTFGTPGPDLRRVRPGQRVWITSSPSVEKQARKAAASVTTGGRTMDLFVHGTLGAPLRVEARVGRHHARIESTGTLVEARRQGLDESLLKDKLGALGGTAFSLGRLDIAALDEGLYLPVSELKSLRRALVADLAPRVRLAARREPRKVSVDALREQQRAAANRAHLAPTRDQDAAAIAGKRAEEAEDDGLIAMCRTDEQLQAVIDAGLSRVELDWMEMVGLGQAVERAKAAGLRVTIATTRVQKPGEEGFDRRIARLDPDGVLVRHWGGLMHFAGASRPADADSEAPEVRQDAARSGGIDCDERARASGETRAVRDDEPHERGGVHERFAGREPSPSPARPVVHGDFSLNVTNSITANELLARGLDTVTAAHDLDKTQLFDLLAHVDPRRITVVIHHHIPTFHTEHCVYAMNLGDGLDFRTCGRPCESHRVALRDREGHEHPIVVDVGCRNTMFNAQAQSAATLVPVLRGAGIRRFRVEFVWESRDETIATLRAYRALLRDETTPDAVIASLRVHEQFGVTLGTMQTLRSND